MTNVEKYNEAFVEVFGVDSAVLNDRFFKRQRGILGFCSPTEYNRIVGRVL